MTRENKPGALEVDSEKDFLSRWSRRKLDAQQDVTKVSADETAAVTPHDPGAVGPQRELTDTDMAPLETLDANSDYSPFLSSGVSDDLRSRALRKLFSQSSFNVIDGLDDYDEDFTGFAELGNVITHEMKRALQRQLAEDEATGATVDEPLAGDGTDEPPDDAEDNSTSEVTQSDVDHEEPGQGSV